MKSNRRQAKNAQDERKAVNENCNDLKKKVAILESELNQAKNALNEQDQNRNDLEKKVAILALFNLG